MRSAAPFALIGFPMAITLGILLRISAFRVDRPGWRWPLGVPYLTNVQVLSRQAYTPPGQRLIPWLWGCVALTLVGWIAAVLVLAGGP